MVARVLRIRDVLVATIPAEFTDSQWQELQDDLLQRSAESYVRAAVIDVGGMVIIDSFAGRILNSLAQMLLLRGVRSVVVGIRPAVAFAMVQLGLRLEGVETALDLDGGLEILESAPTAGGTTT